MILKQQINNFNNDLNQVSHRVTMLFNGYAHVFAVYAVWKHILQNQKNKANKPILQLIKAKEGLKQNFLKKTNQNEIERSKAQAETFVSLIIKFLAQQVVRQKKVQIQSQIQKGRIKLVRQTIQNELQNTSFSPNASEQEAYNYLMNPKGAIELKYNKNIDQIIKTKSKNLKLNEKINQAYYFISGYMAQLYSQIQKIGIKEGDCNYQQFLQINAMGNQTLIEDKGIQIQQEALFVYICNFLSNDQSKQFKVQQIPFNKKDVLICSKQSSLLVQGIIDKIIKSKSVKVANAWHFINFVIQQMKEKIKQLEQYASLNENDQKYIKEQLKVIVCDQKCPGCGRLCGLEGTHKKHMVKYGHQFRAINGVKFQDGNASVIKCEDLDPIEHKVKFNGRDMTYAQFIKIFQEKEPGGWDLSDVRIKTKESKQKDQLFNRAWEKAGRKICKQNNMNFIQVKDVDKQVKSSLSQQPAHYIFAMDQSGSMRGKRWNTLLKAFKQSIDQLKKRKNAKVSVILFNGSPRIPQQCEDPFNIDTNPPFRSGGTKFTPVFQMMRDLAKKYIQNYIINLIFITDGGAEYPQAPLQDLKKLKAHNHKRLFFNCIQIDSKIEMMQKIIKQLEGSRNIAYGQSLTKAMTEIITGKE